MKISRFFLLGIMTILIVFGFGLSSICHGANGNISKFNYEQLIYDGNSGQNGIAKYLSPEVPNQGMDMHSFYDGTYIWYPEKDYGTLENNLIRFNPADDSMTIFPTNSGDENSEFYHAIPDPLDSNIIWSWSAYGSYRSLWKFNKATPSESEYFSGPESTCGSYGGKIAHFTESGGLSRIWGTIVSGGSLSAFNEGEDEFQYYTLHPEDEGGVVKVDAAVISLYGIQADKKNLFVCNTGGAIYAIHNNFTTDGEAILNVAKGINAKYINSDFVRSIDLSSQGYACTDLAWDGTYLWASGTDETSSQAYRITPIFDNDGYVTSLGDLAVYETGNDWKWLAASIKANDKYVMAVWEATAIGKIGGFLIDKTDNFSTWNFEGTFEEISDDNSLFLEEIWPTVTVEIDVPGVIYIGGYSPLFQGVAFCNNNPDICSSVNNSMKLLKMTFNPVLSFSNDVESQSDGDDAINPDWGNATVKKWNYSSDDLCETNGSYPNDENDSMNQNTEENNGKYICMYGEDVDGNKNTWVSANPINVDIPDLDISNVEYEATQDSIEIKWDTNNKADEHVRYGISEEMNEEKDDDDKSREHKLNLKNLESNTTYYFRIRSEDANGGEDRSKTYEVKTGERIGKTAISTAATRTQESQKTTEAEENKTIVEKIKEVPKKIKEKIELFKTSISEEKGKRYLEEIKFQILDKDGNPIPRISITLHSDPKTTMTDENGYATFQDVELGKHKLVFNHDGKTQKYAVNIPEPKIENGEVQLETITVQVKDKSNNWLIYLFGIIIIILGLIILKKRKSLK